MMITLLAAALASAVPASAGWNSDYSWCDGAIVQQSGHGLISYECVPPSLCPAGTTSRPIAQNSPIAGRGGLYCAPASGGNTDNILGRGTGGAGITGGTAGGGAANPIGRGGSNRNTTPPPPAGGDDDGLFEGGGNTPSSTDTGDPSFREIEFGLVPTLRQMYGTSSGGERGVINIAGGQSWALKFRYSGTERANFPVLVGGTNGEPTAGGRYTWRGAISTTKGKIEGEGALCVFEMHNSAYTTCQQPCSRQWHLKFNHPASEARSYWPEQCHLEAGRDYYLNIKSDGPGCVGGAAAQKGCPLVIEAANGAPIELNPSGREPVCRHFFGTGARWTAERGCVVD